MKFMYTSPKETAEDSSNPNIKRSSVESIEIEDAKMTDIERQIQNVVNAYGDDNVTVKVTAKVPKDG